MEGINYSKENTAAQEGVSMGEVLHTQESEFLQADAQGIETAPHTEQGPLMRKLTAFALTSLIAVGIAEGARAQEKETSSTKAETESVESISSYAEGLEQEYRDDHEAFSRIVEEGQTREKVAELKERFGGVINSFLMMHQIESDLELLEAVQQDEDGEETFIKKDFPLGATLGSMASGRFKERWVEKEKVSRDFSVEGLEHLPGLSNEELRSFVDTMYPAVYATDSVSGVRFEPTPNIQGDAMILGRIEGFGMNRFLGRDTRPPIVIYNTPRGMTPEEFKEVFEHEIHHTNDWSNTQNLTSADRVSMLSEVAGRVNADDRYQSSYVENIDPEDTDAYYSEDELPPGTTPQQLLDYIRTSEYWPEIAKAHFDDPEGFAREHPNDSELVVKWVERISGEELQ